MHAPRPSPGLVTPPAGSAPPAVEPAGTGSTGAASLTGISNERRTLLIVPAGVNARYDLCKSQKVASRAERDPLPRSAFGLAGGYSETLTPSIHIDAVWSVAGPDVFAKLA